jgi:hypothetical protein
MVQTVLLFGGSGQGVGVELHWQVGHRPAQGTKIMPLVEHWREMNQVRRPLIAVPGGSRMRKGRPSGSPKVPSAQTLEDCSQPGRRQRG